MDTTCFFTLFLPGEVGALDFLMKIHPTVTWTPLAVLWGLGGGWRRVTQNVVARSSGAQVQDFKGLIFVCSG